MLPRVPSHLRLRKLKCPAAPQHRLWSFGRSIYEMFLSQFLRKGSSKSFITLRKSLVFLTSALLLSPSALFSGCPGPAQAGASDTTTFKHVLLISIDGMHAADLLNCSEGLTDINGGAPYCPNIARLRITGINYLATSTSKPSDSFPGLTAIVSGGSPRTEGAFYDVAYDRSLAPPM